LQKLGTACREHIQDDVWLQAATTDLDPSKQYVFSDVRFPNEADHIRNKGGLIVWVDRPGCDPANGHISETAMDDYEVDHIVWNGGTLADMVDRAWEVHQLAR
jgi:hypothetical protein